MRIDGQDLLIKVCSALLVAGIIVFITLFVRDAMDGGINDKPPQSEQRTETIYFREDGTTYIKKCKEVTGGFYSGKVWIPTSHTECKQIDVEITTP